MPKLTVLIPCKDEAHNIRACIESVRGQDCRFPVEIIIHDDASTDGSVAHIRNQHPVVTVIESADNVGFCTANNRMTTVASGDYLLLLNNDATLFPDALGTLMSEAKRLALRSTELIQEGAVGYTLIAAKKG